MPDPLTIGGVTALLSIFGLKKGADALDDNRTASEIVEEARELHQEAVHRFEFARQQCSQALAELGRRKLRLWDRQLGRFVSLFGSLKNVTIEGGPRVGELNRTIAPEALAEMRAVAIRAGEVMAGGGAALGAGAAAGVAAYGGVMMFGTASTGTAIASLSGVAATNATLAWLGGGSLAAGGAGMAGGALVLGGIVAGPAIALGGILLSAKAQENLARARQLRAEAELAVTEIRNGESALEAIRQLAVRYQAEIDRFEGVVHRCLNGLQDVVVRQGKDYSLLDAKGKQRVRVAVEAVGLLKAMLETPLLQSDGSLDKQADRRLEAGQSARRQLAAGGG